MTKITDERIAEIKNENEIAAKYYPDCQQIVSLCNHIQAQADEIEILTGIIKANGFKDKFNKALAAKESDNG